jgi:hypothetical protein
MSLYDKASLVMIPSGYKASSATLYSVVPNTSVGDFDVTVDADATRLNKDGLIESVSANQARLDYPLTDGVVGDCPHLLLEPSRTNVIPYSVFDAGVPTGWAVGFGTGTFTHELTTFRGQTAIKHTQLTTGRSYLQDSVSLAASTTYTFSMYVDLENSGNISSSEVIAAISMTGDTGDDEVTFGEIDQDTGRCEFTFTTTVSASCNIRLGFGAFSNTSQLNKPIIFSMPQLEAGSYPTSYITTQNNPSGVTRNADFCNGAGDTSTFNDSEGVLFLEFQGLTTTDADNGYVSISDGTATNSVLINTRTSGSLRLYNGGVGSTNLIYIETVDYSNTLKIALQYGTTTGSYKVYINGTSKTISGTFSATAISGLDELKFQYALGGNNFYGKVKQIMVFNEALTDSELEQLTS